MTSEAVSQIFHGKIICYDIKESFIKIFFEVPMDTRPQICTLPNKEIIDLGFKSVSECIEYLKSEGAIEVQ